MSCNVKEKIPVHKSTPFVTWYHSLSCLLTFFSSSFCFMLTSINLSPIQGTGLWTEHSLYSYTGMGVFVSLFAFPQQYKTPHLPPFWFYESVLPLIDFNSLHQNRYPTLNKFRLVYLFTKKKTKVQGRKSKK